MADPAHRSTSESVGVAVVVRPDVAPIDGHGRRDLLDEAGDDRGRQCRRGAAVTGRFRADDPQRPSFVGEDLLGHELLDDPAAKAEPLEGAIRWQVPSPRAATDRGDPLLESGERDRALADDRDTRSGQPLTPPTVMPSTKNRCANRKITTTGRTTKVAAAMSRL